MWINKPPHPPHPDQRPSLSESLKLKGEAKTTVDKLEKQHHHDKKKLMHQDKTLHIHLFELVGTDQEGIEILEKLNANKVEIEKMTFDFFNEVSIHCNDSQKKELVKFIDRAIMRIHSPQRPLK